MLHLVTCHGRILPRLVELLFTPLVWRGEGKNRKARLYLVFTVSKIILFLSFETCLLQFS